MISGHILLTNVGMDLASIEKERRNVVVKSFCDMRDKAVCDWKDKFYADYENGPNIKDLYLHYYDNPSYWDGINTKVMQLLQQTFSNYPKSIDIKQFCDKPEPRAEGGFKYQGCPASGYVYDCETHAAWHEEWNRTHTDCVEWESDIFPFKSKNISLMKTELDEWDEKFDHNDDVVNRFHEVIDKGKDTGEKIAYVKEFGEKICKCNGYHREQELERLEERKGNNRAERIYSIKKKNGEIIFLCIDKRHGMLEWCDDKGDHQGELRFDGSKNGNKTKEPDHGLRCVAEWKRLYDR